MKFADSTRSLRPDSALVLMGALSLAAFSTGCTANSPRDYLEDAQRNEIGTRDGSYAVATSPEDLKRLIAEDLESQNAAAVYEGLEAFIGENISRGTAKRADLIWQSIKPTTMLQYGKGRSVMTGVKQLGEVLHAEGAREMETAFESLRQGDFQEVQRLRDQPMGIFHPDTAALSRDVRPYALLADGVLSYRDVAASSDPTGAEVQMALDKLSAAQSELAKIGETRGMFLADAAAAQALERAGQIDAAAEYWMRIADSKEFLSQPDVMRNLVAARIKTYGVRMKERLIVEVEAERRAELRARDAQYSAQVEQLEEKHQSFDSWARQGFASSARRLAELSQEDDQHKVRLASMASTAEERDAQLGRAQDALAVRLGALDERAGGLEGRTDELTERTAELGDEGDAILQRVDREVALLRGNLEEAVSSLRTDQAGLTARAEALERRASELSNSVGTNATNIDSVQKEAAGLRAQALELRGEAADLASETSSLRAGMEGNQRASQQLASDITLRDADLAQSLRDLANYQAAVEELTANAALNVIAPSLDEMASPELPAAGAEAVELEPAGGSSSDRGSFMALPAYLAVHSMPDVFGVDGQMEQLTAFIMPE
ncbi:MAG: hypothetical protein ACJAZN_003129 [Planctomycetota bacterium]|jgi:hypothetical protein